MASPQDYIAFHQTYGCTNQTTRTVKRQIVVIAVPGTEWIDGREEPAEYTKQFFPINELRAILVPKTVQAILRHRCDYCQQQTLWLPKPDIDKSVDHIVGTSPNHPSLARTAITIFALLIYIENPLLIFNFLQKGDNDDTFAKNTETYEPVRLYEIWRDFHTHHTRASEEVARNFRTQKWHFAIPHMSHGEHTRYQSRHMLPFAMQKELGLHTGAQQQESELDRDRIGHDRGGNGKVFKVELHPGYGNFGRAETPSMIYARKEIAAGNTVWHILDETNNLQKVKKLCHPHLIELIKSYQIGDNNFNLIFPYAKANLHRYLRVPSLGASRTSNRTHNRLWPQMLGVAEGLKLIINRSSSSPESSIGFHFDLKPQNILILEKLQGDTLVISDFGQARLLEHDSFTSRLTFGRGTDSYTPPEHSTGFVIKAQQNKYDIWPLGIILMEVLAFVVQGETGPERLDGVRFTRERGGMDSRFWRLTDQPGKGELKPQVKRFMNDIKDNSHYVNEENKKFVSNVIDLAEDMLQPDPRCRISIDNVVERMKAIFSCERRIAPRREIPLLAGEKVLLSIEKISHTHRMHTKETAFRVYEKAHRNDFELIFDTSDETSIEMPKALRSDVKLCPEFVLKGISLERGAERVISFVHVRDGVISFDDHIYAFDDDEKTDLVFEELTRQGILMKSRRMLQKVAWSRYFTRKESLKDVAVGILSKERAVKSYELGALKVEIWIEGLQYEDDESSADGATSIHTEASLHSKAPSLSVDNAANLGGRRRRRRRMTKKIEPQRRRIVVYCEDRIITVRFAKACRFPSSYHTPDKGIPASGILDFGLTDNAFCFEINQILRDDGHNYVGIPLCWDALAAEEERGKERATSLSLTFENESDAAGFYNEYFEEKNLWLEEVRAQDNTFR